MPRQRPKCLWRVRRTKARKPDLRDGFMQRRGSDLQSVEVGCLTLVSRHAVGGVAFDMLDRLHAFADGECDVLGGHIVLEIDKRLDAGRIARGGKRLQEFG